MSEKIEGFDIVLAKDTAFKHEYPDADSFVSGAKWQFEQSQGRIKELEKALDRAHDNLGNIGQTAWDGNDELKRQLCSSARKSIREALSQSKGGG